MTDLSSTIDIAALVVGSTLTFRVVRWDVPAKGDIYISTAGYGITRCDSDEGVFSAPILEMVEAKP